VTDLHTIQTEAAIENANNALNQALAMGQQGRHAIVLPDNFGLASLEHLAAYPLRQRGTFYAEQIDDFLQYYLAEKTEDSAIFIDTATLSMVGIIDFGTAALPGHKNHQAKWTAAPSPCFAALQKTTRWTQTQFAEFLEDYAMDLTALDSQGGHIPMARAIQAVRAITVTSAKSRTQEAGNFSAGNSAMESVSAKTDHGMPATLELLVPAYQGSDRFMDVPVTVALGTTTGDDKLGIVSRIVSPENIRLRTAQIVAELAKESGEKRVQLGYFSS
jgi:uncharacterized protein YfdQ (DUF2303 family)